MTEEQQADGSPRDTMGRITQTATTAWTQAAKTGQTLYKSALGQAGHLSDQYQNSRAREYVETVMKQTGQGLDTISGKAMYELVRYRLDLQDRYNDLLATKLQEALDRIDQLERRLAEREQGGEHGDDG